MRNSANWTEGAQAGQCYMAYTTNLMRPRTRITATIGLRLHSSALNQKIYIKIFDSKIALDS